MKKLEKSKLYAVLSVLLLSFIMNTNIASASTHTKSTIPVSSLTKMILIVATVLTIGVAILAIIWVVKSKVAEKKGIRRIKLALLSIILVAVIGSNVAVYHYNNVIGLYFSKVKIDEKELTKATKDSKDLTEQIEDEGIVMLENKNNTLPLNQTTDTEKNINVFGQASIGLVYGGSGSGAADETKNVNLQQGLENAGFSVNTELTDFYKKHAPKKEKTDIFNLNGGDYNLSQPATKDFSDELIDNAKKFSDVALIVITRAGGEGADLPLEMSTYSGTKDQHYLELTNAENSMIEMVKSMNFKKVIVAVNSSNAMNLGFLEDEGIDAAVWIGGPGSTGCNSVGKILAGTVNPSGRLVDTYAYDVTSSPAFYNAGNFKYLDSEFMTKNKMTGKEEKKSRTFVNYQEGIYVGYRYYETRYVDNKTGKMDEQAYQKAVQYPFGYGLSYTNFKQEITDYQATDDKVTVKVKVTNNGEVAGKDVVQLYYTAPYTVGGLEKSHVVLGAFDKTGILEPGKSETVTLEIKAEDMASYDYQNEKAYVLDAGNYEIKLMNNAHDLIESREYNVPSKVVYNDNNKRSTDQVAATNHFDDAKGNITYVSRADWEGTLPTERTKDQNVSKELLDALADSSVQDNAEDKDIVVKDHGLTIDDVVGLDYDNPKWDDLLEQLSLDDMSQLIGFGGWGTQAIESVSKPATIDIDGPAGLNGLINGITGVQYTSEAVIASTWNVDISEKMGEYIASEFVVNGVSGLYAPAMNIHRTPFSGRNFEYYSEDGLLSGKMASGVVKGAASKGVYSYIKHFALNDQETNREGISVWSNEQAIREIYLKPFELAVKEGKATAAMAAFDRLGTTWCGAHSGLLQSVLRGEWGFRGMVITDADTSEYMNVDQGIRAGNDIMLSSMGDKPTKASTETNTGKQAMRTASHNILYTIANSKALELGNKVVFPYWAAGLAAADLVLLALATLGFYKVTHKKEKTKKK